MGASLAGGQVGDVFGVAKHRVVEHRVVEHRVVEHRVVVVLVKEFFVFEVECGFVCGEHEWVEVAVEFAGAVALFLGSEIVFGGLFFWFGTVGVDGVFLVDTDVFEVNEVNEVKVGGPCNELGLIGDQCGPGSRVVHGSADVFEVAGGDVTRSPCLGELGEVVDPTSDTHIGPGLFWIVAGLVAKKLGDGAVAGVFLDTPPVDFDSGCGDDRIEPRPQSCRCHQQVCESGRIVETRAMFSQHIEPGGDHVERLLNTDFSTGFHLQTVSNRCSVSQHETASTRPF